MGPTWVLSAPDGPHVGPINLAIRVVDHLLETQHKTVTSVVLLYASTPGHRATVDVLSTVNGLLFTIATKATLKLPRFVMWRAKPEMTIRNNRKRWGRYGFMVFRLDQIYKIDVMDLKNQWKQCFPNGQQYTKPRIWCCHYFPPGSLYTLGASESLSYSHISFNLIWTVLLERHMIQVYVDEIHKHVFHAYVLWDAQAF